MDKSVVRWDLMLDTVTKTVVGQFNREELLNKIIEMVLVIFDAEVCSIFLRKEGDLDTIECVAGAGYGEILKKKKSSYNLKKEKNGEEPASFTGYIARTGTPYNILSRDHMGKLVSEGLPWAKKHNDDIWGKNQDTMRNIMAVPLKVGDNITGVIKVENKKGEKHFSDSDFNNLKTISLVLSLSIENTRLHSISERQQKTLISDLASAVASVVGNHSREVLLNNILTRMMDNFYAEACSIYLINTKNPNELICEEAKGFSSTIIGKSYNLIEDIKSLTVNVYKTQQPIKIDSPADLEKLKNQNKWMGKLDGFLWDENRSFRNLIAIPLLINNECLGLIKLENKKINIENFFTEEDLNHAVIIANVIALAIKNYSLRDENSKQLKAISSKATHRLQNQVLRYDYIEAMLLKIIKNVNTNETKSITIKVEKLLDYIKIINDSSRNIKNTINDISRYGKPLSITKEKVNINIYLHEIISLIKDGNTKNPNKSYLTHEGEEVYIKNELIINEIYEGNLPDISIDKDKMFDVVQELIKNSSKVFQQNIKKEINKVHIINIETSIKNSDNHPSIELKISDNGPGLPMDINIFEPFVTSDLYGTGLGLAITKEIIEGHNGTIYAENLVPPSNGSSFIISLPIIQ